MNINTLIEIMDIIRNQRIKAIRLSDDQETLEIKLENDATLEIKTDCDYDNYHRLAVSAQSGKPDGWIT